MYKDDYPVGSFKDDAVERRRAAEAERKIRIFNTRIRVIGVDQDALDKQVWEKKQQQNTKRQQDKAFDDLNRRHDEELLRLERAEKVKQAAVHTELSQFWATQQRLEDSRDADLKCDLKGAFRTSIPEGELGAASMQIFQGEGIGQEQKRRELMQNIERDLRVQTEDDVKRQRVEKYKEMLAGKEVMRQDLRVSQLQALEEECKKAARVAQDNYNHALAAQQAERLKEQRRREEGQGLAEVRQAVTSDMLSECPEAAERDVGGGRPPKILVDRWRGMRPEELSAIHREQEAQRLERQKQCEAEKIRNMAWDLQQLEISREAEERRMREETLMREKKIELDRRNMQLAEEQRLHQEYLNKRVYTNKPTQEYFGQFNTTSR